MSHEKVQLTQIGPPPKGSGTTSCFIVRHWLDQKVGHVAFCDSWKTAFREETVA